MPDANVTPIRADGGWATDPGGYSREEFYTSSRSADGQSVTLSVTVPAHMASQLAALIQSGKLPVRTREDVVRDALHHRLHDYEEFGLLDFESTRRIALWRRQEELERHRAEVESTEHLIESTRALVQEARGKNDMVLLEKVAREAREAAADLHEPWRGRLLEVVDGLGEEAE